MRKLWREQELWVPVFLIAILGSCMQLNALHLEHTRGPIPEHLRD